ncbi:MAG TPA: helix-turn-helix domain-containing protein [Bacilli bacterium]|nr:helix-turn-helix domain-containing protein [Bacilli bacterium]HQC90359.1 helix-turn-helix domain-containing protein [Bacilli bacterium]
MGNRLRYLRKKRGLTLRELETEVNISNPTLSRLENGQTSFTEEYIKVLTKYFGVTTDYLLGYEKPKLTLKLTKKLINHCQHYRLYLKHKNFINTFLRLPDADKKVIEDIAKSFLARYGEGDKTATKASKQ